jgi:hypothetical protein
MLRVLTLEEAEAAERAGVDMVSIPPEFMLNPQERDAAPSLFTMPGDNVYEIGTADDFVRWAMLMYKASADAVYCSASHATVKRMADEAIAVIGHVGLIPSRKTWSGGFKAVDKTAASAMQIAQAVKELEAARAFGAEIEVVRSRSPRPFAKAPGCPCFRWVPARDATHNICSPTTYSARSADTCRRAPRHIATSLPNMTGCRPSVSQPFPNSPPTSPARPIWRNGTSYTCIPTTWIPTSSDPSWRISTRDKSAPPFVRRPLAADNRRFTWNIA